MKRAVMAPLPRRTTSRLVSRILASIGALLLGAALAAAAAKAPASQGADVRARGPHARIEIDATDAPRHLLHARIVLPVKPGPVSLIYPKWIPGEHGPTGPVADVAGLKITAGGETLRWTRDPEDMYAIRCDVPSGTSSLGVSFDFLLPPSTEGFTSASSTTAQLAVLSWNQVVLYPAGASPDAIVYDPVLRLPKDWKHGSALVEARSSGDTVTFEPVSLTTLVDSPVLLGAHFRTIDLTGTRTGPVFLHIAADSEAALDISRERQEKYVRLAAEINALFGARHYRSYHFLLSLSDLIAHFGLEHHESSDNRSYERSLIDDDRFALMGQLLSHEFSHSWNGKYRRPEGLATHDFQKPMKGDLLWVYEGLTQYLGYILAARSGLWSPEQYRDALALGTARLDAQSGRTWRPLSDTAVEAQLLYEARRDWSDYRRGVDFYDEGNLIWLETDVTIRRLTAGRKSLDDFCKAFHGAPGGPPEVKTYTFDDVVAALNSVAPFAWKGFLTERLASLSAHAPMGGLSGSGWRLGWTDTVTPHLKAWEAVREKVNLAWSLGVILDKEGRIEDAIRGLPAAGAGLSPGMKIVAVNGRRYEDKRLREAIRAARDVKDPLEILIENGDYFKTYSVDYHGGERYPRFERDTSRPDMLSDIIAPRTSARP
jgi:predicted metalloprotease with PDZ domain